ncbi:hypothetical protein Scep_009499 [Stephania cephalantha]|uniref:Uncharacterized protein n=1 Tax=Stephania cephalantha TaxID=152367 RepID=A0AAP0JUR3_9MAGN
MADHIGIPHAPHAPVAPREGWEEPLVFPPRQFVAPDVPHAPVEHQRPRKRGEREEREEEGDARESVREKREGERDAGDGAPAPGGGLLRRGRRRWFAGDARVRAAAAVTRTSDANQRLDGAPDRRQRRLRRGRGRVGAAGGWRRPATPAAPRCGSGCAARTTARNWAAGRRSQ